MHAPPMSRAADRIVAATAAAIVVLTATVVQAAPGDLDASFSTDGIAVVDFGGTSQEFFQGARDGAKVVAVGPVDEDFAIAKLQALGDPDGGFGGGDGMRLLDFGHEDVAYGVVVDRDGRISVVGSANDAHGDGRVAVARLRAGGALDTSFNGDGLMTARSPDGLPVYGYDAVLQPDGKLVVVGETYDGTAGRFFAMRLRQDGLLDRTFGGDGKVLVNFGPGDDGAWKTALTSSGKIVLAGWSDNGVGGDQRSAAARLLPDGRLDRSFNGDGTWVKDLSPGNYDSVAGLALTDDDEILLGVDLFSNGSYDPHVLQLTRSGAFDDRFGGGDGMSSNWADGYRLVDLAVRGNGQIAGILGGGNITSFRLGHRGMPDPAYGAGGLVFTSTPLTTEAMYLDKQDRPVVTGSWSGDPEVIRLQA